MRIEINEPQAIWDKGQQAEQHDNIYPKKGEADQADRIFIVSSGQSADGTTSQNIINNISGYFKRYRSSSGEITDDEIRASLDTCHKSDGTVPSGISFVMICLHREGVTIVSVGNCHLFQIRPSAKRIVYENKGSEKSTITNPLIYHTDDIEMGDYFYACTNGMLDQSDSDKVCQFFSAEGSNDLKRNVLRNETSGIKANHAAYFFNIRTIISDDGSELAGRRPIVIPEIKSATPISNNDDEDDDDEDEVVRPTQAPEPSKPQPKPQPKQEPRRPQQPKPRTQTKHQPRPISQYEDERQKTNVRMVILVAVIVILAIAAGMLWYFNSSSTKSVPVDTTEVTPEVKDTTATPTAEPADSAIIPDSAYAEPQPDVTTEAPRHHEHATEYTPSTTEDVSTDEPATDEPATEPEHKTESEPTKSAPAETPKSEPSTSTTTE